MEDNVAIVRMDGQFLIKVPEYDAVDIGTGCRERAFKELTKLCNESDVFFGFSIREVEQVDIGRGRE